MRLTIVEHKNNKDYMLSEIDGVVPRIGETLCIPKTECACKNDAKLIQFTRNNRYKVIDIEYNYCEQTSKLEEVLVTVKLK